jgi:hypothetical protein
MTKVEPTIVAPSAAQPSGQAPAPAALKKPSHHRIKSPEEQAQCRIHPALLLMHIPGIDPELHEALAKELARHVRSVRRAEKLGTVRNLERKKADDVLTRIIAVAGAEDIAETVLAFVALRARSPELFVNDATWGLELVHMVCRRSIAERCVWKGKRGRVRVPGFRAARELHRVLEQALAKAEKVTGISSIPAPRINDRSLARQLLEEIDNENEHDPHY